MSIDGWNMLWVSPDCASCEEAAHDQEEFEGERKVSNAGKKSGEEWRW